MRLIATFSGALGLCLLAACAETPQLNLPVVANTRDAALAPLGPLLAAADGLDAQPRSGPDLAGDLQSRAAALRARAARLRGPVIPAATRARMRAGAGR